MYFRIFVKLSIYIHGYNPNLEVHCFIPNYFGTFLLVMSNLFFFYVVLYSAVRLSLKS